MEGPAKKLHSKRCLRCSNNSVFRHGPREIFQENYCFDCILATRIRIHCIFCGKFTGYAYGCGPDSTQGNVWCGCRLTGHPPSDLSTLTQSEKDIKNGLLLRTASSCKITKAFNSMILIKQTENWYVCVTEYSAVGETFSIPKEFDTPSIPEDLDEASIMPEDLEDIATFAYFSVLSKIDKWFWKAFGEKGVFVFQIMAGPNHKYAETCSTPIRIKKQEDGQIAFWKLEKLLLK